MFKNATLFRATPGFHFDPDLMQRRLFMPCGRSDHHSDGFVPPCDHSTEVLTHGVGPYQIICWQTEDKVLPGSVVAEAVEEAVEKIEHEQGYRPGRKQLREIKEAVIHELLPKAFTQKRQTLAALAGDYFIIDTSSASRASGFIDCIKQSLDMIPFELIRTTHNPVAAVSMWMMGELELPAGATFDQDATIESTAEGSPQIRYCRTDIETDEIINRLNEGWLPKKVAMSLDHISFNLTPATFQLSRIELPDVINDKAPESAEEACDIELVLRLGEIVSAADLLVHEFGGMVKREGLF